MEDLRVFVGSTPGKLVRTALRTSTSRTVLFRLINCPLLVHLIKS